MRCLSQLGPTASLSQRAAWVYPASGGAGGIINNDNKAIKNMICLRIRLGAERRNLSLTAAGKCCQLLLYAQKTLSIQTEMSAFCTWTQICGCPDTTSAAPAHSQLIKQWLDAGCSKYHFSVERAHRASSFRLVGPLLLWLGCMFRRTEMACGVCLG